MRCAIFNRIVAGLLVCGCCAVITGCDKKNSVEGKVFHQDGGPMTIEFKDGKANVELLGEKKSYDYKLEGEKLTILNKAEGNMELTYRSDGTLTGPMGTLKTTK